MAAEKIQKKSNTPIHMWFVRQLLTTLEREYYDNNGVYILK